MGDFTIWQIIALHKVYDIFAAGTLHITKTGKRRNKIGFSTMCRCILKDKPNLTSTTNQSVGL